jgi:hypothetical protein
LLSGESCELRLTNIHTPTVSSNNAAKMRRTDADGITRNSAVITALAANRRVCRFDTNSYL